MFTANIGTTDRLIRIAAGLALLLWFFLDPQGGGTLHWLKGVVGIIAVATAALNFCPLYRVLGFTTR